MITTVNRQLAQQIVATVQDICGHDINFINQKGIIFASTNEQRIGTFHEIGKKAADTRTVIEVQENDIYQGTEKGVNIPVAHNGSLIAVIGITGDPDEVRSYACLAEKITRLLIREQEMNAAAHTLSEKKGYIIQSLISGDIDNPEYIINELKTFHLAETTKKRILCIQIHSEQPNSVLSVSEEKIHKLLRNMDSQIYYFQYPNEYIVVMEEASFTQNQSAFRTFAEENASLLTIGVGCAKSIFHLHSSYNSARIALRSRKYKNTNIILFDDLTLEILLGSVPAGAQKEYLKKTLSSLSADDRLLLDTYFNEGQSLSRTCQKLYLHKNTLQYKLDRIHRICGLNPRDFKDAVILYLAVLISNIHSL